jgi:hypothetical protein
MAKRPTRGKKKAPVRHAAKAAKKAPKGRTRKREPLITVTIPPAITLALPPALHERLKGLANAMGLTLEGVLRQALSEFADTWEEHHRTVASLAEPTDRVQLRVREE